MDTTTIKNINNLNVFTFIREIYQSLKHIDLTINTMNENMNSRLNKLEEQQHIMKTQFDNIELLLQKTLETSQTSNSLNKNIEHELLNKMSRLNNNTLQLNAKIDLKPHELTFANILENDYNLDDINNQLQQSYQQNWNQNQTTSFTNLDANLDANALNTQISTNVETLDSLLF
jgi:hypothetical protein